MSTYTNPKIVGYYSNVIGSASGLNTLNSPDSYMVDYNSSRTQSFIDTFTGTTNPAWRNQIRLGANATTPAAGTLFSVSADSFSAFSRVERFDIVGQTIWEEQRSSGTLPYSYSPLIAPAADVMSRVHNRLISKWFSQVESIQSSFQAGQDLGEWKQTRDAIMHPLRSLRDHTLGYFNGLNKIRRGLGRRSSISGSKSLAHALNDSYLEWTFGWNPLVSDIANAVVGLQTRKDRNSLNKIEVSAHEDYSSSDGEETIPTGLSILTLNFGRTVKCRYTERIKGAIRNSSVVGGEQSVQSLFQLAPKDFLPTAWNLLPYSFVVDYFLNIGDIINAFSYGTGDLAWGNFTTRTITSTNYALRGISGTLPGPPYQSRGSAFGGSASFDAVAFSRDVLSQDLLVPSLQFSLPLGSNKPWENIASLLFSASKKLVPFF